MCRSESDIYSKMAKTVTILGIESSCDDTSAAVIRDGILLSNVIASQKVHEIYGGVVPELASRAHQQNIVPVVDTALKQAGIGRGDLSAVAFTRGPGLIGSLLVGTSFAKGLSLGLRIPMVDVNHLHGHVLSHFVRREPADEVPEFPYLCLLISGGNSQLILVRSPRDMEVLGRTIDDAAGEAFDKCAKVMGLPYPVPTWPPRSSTPSSRYCSTNCAAPWSKPECAPWLSAEAFRPIRACAMPWRVSASSAASAPSFPNECSPPTMPPWWPSPAISNTSTPTSAPTMPCRLQE